MAKNYMAQALNRTLSKGDMESISRAIVESNFHQPTVHLKATKDYEILRQQAEALRKLFDLDPIAPRPSSHGQGAPDNQVKYRNGKNISQLSKH